MVTIPLSELGPTMHKIADAIAADVNVFVQDVGVRIAYQVIYRTAVDVGTARSSWIASIGAPTYAKGRAYSPFRSRWRPLARSYWSAGGFPSESANLRPALSRITTVLRGRQIDQTIYIQNNVPYIEQLAAGHSRQWASGQMMAGVAIGLQQAVVEIKFRNLQRVTS